ncbi:unnamed protein product [Absidia cylindrospora]
MSMAPFGHIADIGIKTEPETGLYMGSGYAVLNLTNSPDKTKMDECNFTPLAHNINWCEDSEDKDVFHATWSNMPTWCRYCHQEGHTKISCSKSKARIICYNCHELGHRSKECPRANPGTAKKRKPTQTTPKDADKNQPQSTNPPISTKDKVDKLEGHTSDQKPSSSEVPQVDKQTSATANPSTAVTVNSTDNAVPMDTILTLPTKDEDDANDPSYEPSDQSDDDSMKTDDEMDDDSVVFDSQQKHVSLQQHTEGDQVTTTKTPSSMSSAATALDQSPHITTSRRTSLQIPKTSGIGPIQTSQEAHVQ